MNKKERKIFPECLCNINKTAYGGADKVSRQCKPHTLRLRRGSNRGTKDISRAHQPRHTRMP